MLNLNDIIRKLLNDFIVSIENALDTKNINDTGRASNSMLIEQPNKNNWQVLGIGYMFFLNYGRAAGKFPPVDKMKAWVKSKLGLTNEKEIDQAAYLVGRKISESGTNIYQDQSKGIELEQKIEKLSDELAMQIADETSFILANTLQKQYLKAF